MKGRVFPINGAYRWTDQLCMRLRGAPATDFSENVSTCMALFLCVRRSRKPSNCIHMDGPHKSLSICSRLPKDKLKYNILVLQGVRLRTGGQRVCIILHAQVAAHAGLSGYWVLSSTQHVLPKILSAGNSEYDRAAWSVCSNVTLTAVFLMPIAVFLALD